MADVTPLYELTGVGKRYGSEGAASVAALDAIDLRIEPAEAVALVGPSGSGKSTLLHLLGALDRPTSGQVRFEGADLAGRSDDDLAHLRNGAFGFVFQAHYLLPQCTAIENVLVPALAERAAVGSDLVDRAKELLARVGLGDRMSHRPGELSGGQAQRVALARALIHRPRVLLADEPTGSVDQSAAADLADLMFGLNRDEGVTLVVATHAPTLAARFARRLTLRDGRLVEGGPP